MRRKSAAVSNALVALVALTLGVTSGCGSVTASNDGGGGSGGSGPGAGGSVGTGGSPGTGGAGTGGSHGTGGANGTGGSNGTGGANGTGGSSGHGGTGGVGTGGSAGHGGTGGVGTGGAGGSAGKGGTGGVGTGGAGGSAGKGGTGGAGGVGGASACQAVLALDRSCTTATDCFAAVHQTNCCGQRTFTGIRTSAQAEYQDLEAKCEATYPLCECAVGQPTTDDGSKIQFSATAGVDCVQGLCTTFAKECGKPCASGTTCFSCSNHSLPPFAACTTMCAGSTDCHDSTLPLCQFGMSGNTSGMFCTATGVACDTK